MVLLCLFTHAMDLQCNISGIVPGTPKKLAINGSQFANGRIVGQRGVPQCGGGCIKFQPYIQRHSTPDILESRFNSPPAKAWQAPVAERPVALPPELQGAVMPQSHIFDPSFPDVERPGCRKCGTAMWLSHITPDRPSRERRTFECPACDSSRSLSTTTTSKPAPSPR